MTTYTIKTLSLLKNCEVHNISRLSREHNLNQSWVFTIIKQMEKDGLVKTTRVGRGTKITLTKKGEKVRDAVCVITAHIHG